MSWMHRTNAAMVEIIVTAGLPRCLPSFAGGPFGSLIQPVNNRQFRQHIAELLERQRREAEAQAKVPVAKKPPASVKAARKAKKSSA